jgi:uncharacterized protein (TIGR00369 family)
MAAIDDPWIEELMPFARLIGVRVVSTAPEEVWGELDWAPDRCTAASVVHGGALMTLADTLGAICAFLNLRPGEGTSTIESKTNFFRAVGGGTVKAVSRPLHAGRTTVVVQTDLWDDQGRRVAQVTQTQAVLAPRRP